MKQYEVTFIVDPVLSGDEIKTTATAYETMLKNEGCQIVNFDDMGLKTLAYSINKKSSGFYYCIEYTAESGAMISKMELALRRDERILRFLTIALDKYAVKYNEDKRNGVIGKAKKKAKHKADGTPEGVAPVVAEETTPVVAEEVATPEAPIVSPVVIDSEEE